MQISSLDQLVGQNIGAYQVERLLGHGRVNAVYLAYHSTKNSPVALMMFILPEKFSFEARQRFLQRFRKVAARLIALRHPHILPVYDYGDYAGYPYLITPYMANGSLADLLKRGGRLGYTDVLDILQQVVAGLAYAHDRGIFHGALKPSNIVLNDQRQMLVAGFGLTQILQMRGIEQDERPYGHLFSITGTFLTSAEYIAPEMVQGQSRDGRTDIYSLGIILFELLSGKTPFAGTDPLEVAKQHLQPLVPSLRTYRPDIPPALAAVVDQALDRDPARRFQRVDELLEAFAQVSATWPEKGTIGTEPVVTAKSSQEALYDLWTLPPQGPLPPRRLDSAQRNTSPTKRRSVQRSRPLTGRKTRGNERVTRRKVVASLVAGGVAVIGVAVAVRLTGNASSQQVQSNAANLAKNAALNFMNPADGKASVLVHLADGNFVAYDRACTHKGVYVYYDPAMQLLVCPAHGATFDPAQAGAVVQGVPNEPPIKPLPKVTVHINADGMIVA